MKYSTNNRLKLKLQNKANMKHLLTLFDIFRIESNAVWW